MPRQEAAPSRPSPRCPRPPPARCRGCAWARACPHRSPTRSREGAGPVAARQCTGRSLRRRIRRFHRILPDAPADLLDRLAVPPVDQADTPGSTLRKRRLHPRPESAGLPASIGAGAPVSGNSAHGRASPADSTHPTGSAPGRAREPEHWANGIVVNKTVDNRFVDMTNS